MICSDGSSLQRVDQWRVRRVSKGDQPARFLNKIVLLGTGYFYIICLLKSSRCPREYHMDLGLTFATELTSLFSACVNEVEVDDGKGLECDSDSGIF